MEPARIFVSYRREDSSGWVGRLVDDLSQRFGAEHVFQDIHSIKPGADFLDAITDTLRQADCVLVVIGPAWLGAKDEAGGRRIDDENDYVRLELATALRGGSRVIPVLVGGARMPTPAQLPEDIRALARRNAAELSDSRWSYDLDQLVQTIAGLEKPQPQAQQIPGRSRRSYNPVTVPWLVLLAVAGAVALGWWLWSYGWPRKSEPVASIDRAIIVFGSDKSPGENGAQAEVDKAERAGFESATIYFRKGLYLSVVAFPTKRAATEALPRIQALSETARKASVKSLSELCPNGLQRSNDVLGVWNCL